MPQTMYAKSGDVSIAYQVTGDGPRDLVYVPGFVSNIEVMWDDPRLAEFLERLASFSRLITFDKRGTGVSDPVPPDQLPTLETRMDDLRAVMDSVGSSRATLFGHSEGGNMCILFATTYPERTDGLILTGSYAKRIRSDDYPWAPTREERIAHIEEVERTWGASGLEVQYYAPSRANDPAFVEWLKRYARLSASPKAAAALIRMNSEIDVTSLLSSVRVPTLLLYRVDDPDVSAEEGRYIASKIPGAKFIELAGGDHFFWAGDAEPLIAEIEEFMTGQRTPIPSDRVLATVMFTDIVGSTEIASAKGDQAWLALLERHHQLVRAQLTRWRGREENTAGDGFLATFDGPARAIRCARSIAVDVRRLGLEIRCGLHTGEIEIRADGVGGLAVHIGARIAALAAPGEVLVSRTVRDLVSGAGLEFAFRGTQTLKGVTEPWDLFAVVGG